MIKCATLVLFMLLEKPATGFITYADRMPVWQVAFMSTKQAVHPCPEAIASGSLSGLTGSVYLYEIVGGV
jgi:hypothetical protein